MGVTPDECLLEGSEVASRGETIFTFKGTFISTFALNSIGQTCSSVFPFSVRTAARTSRGKGRGSNRPSVVRELWPVSRVVT